MHTLKCADQQGLAATDRCSKTRHSDPSVIYSVYISKPRIVYLLSCYLLSG